MMSRRPSQEEAPCLLSSHAGVVTPWTAASRTPPARAQPTRAAAPACLPRSRSGMRKEGAGQHRHRRHHAPRRRLSDCRAAGWAGSAPRRTPPAAHLPSRGAEKPRDEKPLCPLSGGTGTKEEKHTGMVRADRCLFENGTRYDEIDRGQMQA